ncbi:uncharacterized protein LOC134870954 [Eleginops maclovinus]|uniref:uncharacterized protein LOC134870954 n=1 Tax=Eleginops maclovinus TaxID=56733 RepID=UPI003080CE2A
MESDIQSSKNCASSLTGASFGGTSLNQQLLQGPDLTSSLVGVLMRFRQETVAVMADVEAMFYQVRVSNEDTDLLRFLWWPDRNYEQELVEHKMLVHIFRATSSPSVATFALQKCATDFEEEFCQEAARTVKKNFYVDDCLKSTTDEDTAITLCADLRNMLAKGGFRLTKWSSNSRKLLNSIPEEEKARVAPLKSPTIPRMELTAATVAIKMDKLLKKELELELHDSIFWTDSTAVLKYLNSESTRFKTFVANRISAILEHSQTSQWRYVNTTLNPADHVSRGQTVEAFLKCESWLSGPNFLLCSQDQWPKNLDPGMLDVNDPEVKEMYSDNGTNFRSADSELKKSIQEWNTKKIAKQLQQKGVQWHFNPPAGSHHGGSWERLIRSVRKILNITVKEQLLDEEGLHTLLCEAEAVINSRPITKSSSDLNDLEALTPKGYSTRTTSTLIVDGDRSSTSRTGSGNAGARNTSCSFKNVNDGSRLEETSASVMWC